MMAPASRRRRSSDENQHQERDLFPDAAAMSPFVVKVSALVLGLMAVCLLLTSLNRSLVVHTLAPRIDVNARGQVVEAEPVKGLMGGVMRGLRGGPNNSTLHLLGSRSYDPPRVVHLLPEQLAAMDSKNRTLLFQELYSGSVILNPSENRLHGLVGIGMDGKELWQPQEMAVPLEELNMVKELRMGGGFNLKYSDSLPLNRDVRDNRDGECRKEWDITLLPRASVIIVFHNEPKSTLLRSIHSVYNYTPPELLEEIILVDDGSTLEWMSEIDNLVAHYPKMKIIHLETRVGIVGARMAGIRKTAAPIFVILDSHIEAQPQWLEPLVQRIGDDPTVIIMPQVDSLDAENFTYSRSGIGCTLGFLWKMIEHSFDPDNTSPKDRLSNSVNTPVSSPTMAGGLFGANKSFFLEDLGGYDEGFEYWGTENLELSFRLWQCGGRLECAACSRVYHVFRKGGVGYSSPQDSLTKNKLRLLASWMDEYADLAYKVLGEPTGVDFGNVAAVKRIREEKHCRSFRWYLENVNPESQVLDLKRDVPYLGKIGAAGAQEYCLVNSSPDSPSSGGISLEPCVSTSKRESQFMYFIRTGRIMPVVNDESCLSSVHLDKSAWCEHGNTTFKVESVAWALEKPSADSNAINVQIKVGSKCLTSGADYKELSLEECDDNDQFQVWSWSRYSPPEQWTPPMP